MKGNETPATPPEAADGQSGDIAAGSEDLHKRKHRAEFIPATDSRNRRIPGLYTRNGRFYGLLWTTGEDGRGITRRFPLLDDDGLPIRTISAARVALDTLKHSRREDQLPRQGRKPALADFVAEYLAMESTRRKKVGTQKNEKQALARWSAQSGSVRIDRMQTPSIKAFMEMRLRGCRLAGKEYEPAHARTVKLEMVALRNVLKAAVEAGHLRNLPQFPKLSTPPPPRRPLLTPAEFDRLLASCTATRDNGTPVSRNGEQLRDFLRLLAFSGAREKEALRLRWSHADFSGRRIFIGADEAFVAAAMTIGTGGTSKNRGSRSIDFNPQLEQLLRDMHARRAPETSYIFPSPQRGERDIPAKSLRESLRQVRAHARLPQVGFHDLRHLFCSFAVMAGIDFLTIAGWLGHKDGGILIGKVYGHLLDEHRQKMAAKLTIGFTEVREVERLTTDTL